LHRETLSTKAYISVEARPSPPIGGEKMNYLVKFCKALGVAVDTAVPFALGARTKIAVVACPVLGFVSPLIPPPYVAAVPFVQAALCGTATLFALAGLVRDATAPK